MSRRWLIGVSLVAHLGVVVAVCGARVWPLDRLTADAAMIAHVNTLLYPAAPCSPPTLRRPKPSVVKRPPIELPQDGGEGCGWDDTCVETVPVCGDGVLGAREECDDGNTADGDGCSSTCRVEAKWPRITLVAATVLEHLRVSGDTRLQPDPATLQQIRRDGRTTARWAVKVCVSADGRVSSAVMLMSSRYDAYDAAILSAIRGWRYRPYFLDGVAVPVCSAVSFRS